jgi:hypothetical protein
MAFWEDTVGGLVENPVGWVVGIGAVLLAPTIIPAVSAALRPVAKTAIKGGVYIYDQASQLVQGARESTADMIAEARAELAVPAATPLTPSGRSEPVRKPGSSPGE